MQARHRKRFARVCAVSLDLATCADKERRL